MGEIAQVYGVVVTAVIMGIIGMLKSVISLRLHKYMGLVAWGLGVAIAFAYGRTECWTVLRCVLVGSAVGLSAAGFYSTQKNSLEE